MPHKSVSEGDPSVVIICPNCSIPFSVIPGPRDFLYPKDNAEIFRLISGKFNLFICPVCKASVHLVTEISVLNSGSGKGFVFSSDVGREVENPVLQNLTDELEFRFQLRNWVVADLKPLFSSFDISKSNGIMDRKSYTPFELQGMLALCGGYLGVRFEAKDEFGEPVAIEEVYQQIVLSTIGELIRECMTRNEIAALFLRMESGIPSACFTEQVLTKMADNCAGIPEGVHWQDVKALWICEYAFAIGCFLAGKKNPRVDDFVMKVLFVWKHEASIKENYPTDFGQLILNAEILELFVGADVVIDRCLDIVFAAAANEQAIHLSRLLEIMKHYGWSQRLGNAASNFTRLMNGSGEPIKPSTDLYTLLELDVQKAGDMAVLHHNADILHTYLCMLLRSFNFGTAMELSVKVLDAYEAQGFWVAYMITHIAVTKAYRVNLSSQLIADIVHNTENIFAGKLSTLPGSLEVAYYIEASHFYADAGTKQALHFCRLAETRLLSNDVDEKEKAYWHQVLIPRQMTLYKRTGNYKKAITLGRKQLKLQAGDFGLEMILAEVYIIANISKEALPLLLPYEKSKAVTDVQHYLIITLIAWAYIREQQEEQAYLQLSIAFREMKEAQDALKFQMFNIFLMLSDKYIDQLEAEQQALTEVEAWVGSTSNLHKQMTIVLLFSKYLRDKELDKARQLSLQHPDILLGQDWRAMYYALVFHFETGDFETAASKFLLTLRTLNQEIPAQDNAEFAAAWLTSVNEMQEQLVHIAYHLYELNLLPLQALLLAVDLKYGQEIAVKIAQRRKRISQERLTEELSKKAPDTDIFVVFELGPYVHLLHFNSNSGRLQLFPELFEVEAIAKIEAQVVRAFKYVSPGFPEFLDQQLRSFNTMLAQLYKTVVNCLGSTTKHIHFCPGRAFANLPLQLLRSDQGQYLMEVYNVTQVPNVTILSHLKSTTKREGQVMVVSVPKANDDYVQRVQTHEKILADFKSMGKETVSALGTEATLKVVMTKLKQADEVVFLCHGASGNSTEGRGICLAYRKHLPPPIMTTGHHQFLKNFLLTWKDLERLKNTPELFVSMACSSGLVTIQKGGIHQGLEQAVFAKGTLTMISPQWDIHNEAAIFWLEQFYQFRAEAVSRGDAYRLACLAVRDRFAHFYFWAPFVIKGVI
ncbi:CHAT domain-containing protein [Mucilaginibacter flavidus]|uniref:CHAT domain-containing protein n=1 Tax=Mucilaginibacter flavidus TaxID=2949309 RepID=UPI002093AC50|nr:CHAT domain-containing protein [Mucilaginibacter flavidus]MCO5948171.1 CHAT domain-containing protein [Mucilaginibacter flavidus]